VAADDPLLTARPPGPRVATRVVLTASGELPDRCRLRATARDVPVLVYTAAGNEGRLGGWAADGCEVVGLNELMVDAVLAELGRRRVTNVLVEGGAGVEEAPEDAGAADEVHVFIAPKVVGGDTALSPVGGAGVGRIAEAMRFGRVEWSGSGEDTYCHAVRSNRPG
jgi:diaminohydroxyphosphoribosylaminopyrimidine deaminase/5-amino-6-(5-phosphoribosylamino)uracil reductase